MPCVNQIDKIPEPEPSRTSGTVDKDTGAVKGKKQGLVGE
jgi:hypothetical protein